MARTKSQLATRGPPIVAAPEVPNDQHAPLKEKDPNVNAAERAKPSADDASTKQPSKTSSSAEATSPNAKRTSPNTTAADLSTIHLDGEESESVPIYATCDDVRRDISRYLSKTGIAKAAFARELSELLPSSKATARNLEQLLRMKGPAAGAHNIAFYAAYVFFEKLRVRENKKKSAKRQKMEEIYKDGPGLPREGSHNMRVFTVPGEKARLDQYGQLQLSGDPRRGGPISRTRVGNS